MTARKIHAVSGKGILIMAIGVIAALAMTFTTELTARRADICTRPQGPPKPHRLWGQGEGAPNGGPACSPRLVSDHRERPAKSNRAVFSEGDEL
jgi:hypothetical protein